MLIGLIYGVWDIVYDSKDKKMDAFDTVVLDPKHQHHMTTSNGINGHMV